jgi:hypothetical protein
MQWQVDWSDNGVKRAEAAFQSSRKPAAGIRPCNNGIRALKAGVECTLSGMAKYKRSSKKVKK